MPLQLQYLNIESNARGSLGQRLLGGCHGNLGVDGDPLPGLTSNHSYNRSPEPAQNVAKFRNISFNIYIYIFLTQMQNKCSLFVGNDINAGVVKGG